MWNLGVRTIALCAALSAALGTTGCLSSSRYDGARDDYSRVSAPSRSRTGGPGDIRAVVSASSLSLPELVRAVLARNPGLEEARSAWRASLTGYAEATSYDDTRLTYTLAPLSVVSSDARFGHTVQVSQALPYAGKRKLRGDIVLAEAEAKREGYRAVRRRLAAMTGRLYYDYYAVGRALVINTQHEKLVEKHRDAINAYMVTSKAWLEDAAAARVALAQLARQRLALESARDVIVAQLNALLHRAPESKLPPPPAALPHPTGELAPLQTLTDTALAARPELRAVKHRQTGAQHMLRLADRERKPDFRVIGTYNTMFASIEHQIMVGLSVNLPVQTARRRGAADRARATLRGARASESKLKDDVALQVKVARRRAVAADGIAAMYRDKVLPAARARVSANQTGLSTGRTNFVDVIREERGLKQLELDYVNAVADAYRHRIDLAAATGQIAGFSDKGGRDE